MTDPHQSLAPLQERIDQALRSQRRRILGRLFWHGLGLCLAAALFGLALFYFTDKTLDLPVSLRLLATALGTGGFVVLMWYHVLRPQRLRLEHPDVAIAIERRFPDLREKLISAVQLGELARSTAGDLRNQSPAMIEQVVADAARQLQELPTEQVLTWRHTGRAWVATAAGVLLVGLGGLSQGDSVWVFLRRALGANEPYPKQTSLRLELPPADADYHLARDGQQVTLTMAAGGDLPVLVHADGVVPREVYLAIQGGRGMPNQVATAARGNARFRHVFRRITDGFEFHARGGDDDYGDLRVKVVTIRPPRVGTIRAALTYPAYTGRAPVVQEGGGIEALEGTVVALEIAPLGEVANGKLTMQESGEQLQLEARSVADDGGQRTVLAGSLVLRKTDRYQVELVSREGLRNPQGATYPIVVLPDTAPSGLMLSPNDEAQSAVLPGAIVPLRVLAKDDFGLTELTAEVVVGEREPQRRGLAQGLLAGRTQVVTTDLLPLAQLVEGGAVKEGESISLQVKVKDNYVPQAHESKLPNRTIHVVGLSDMERRIASQFRRVRSDVERTLELQRDQRERLTTLRGEAGKLAAAERTAALTALQVAQGRVQSTAARVHGEMMRSFNLHLFNPLDEGAQLTPAIELYLQHHRNPDDVRPLVPEFYRAVASGRTDGRIGSLGKLLDRIVVMTASADRVAEQLAPACVQQLAGARSDSSELDTRLTASLDLQNQTIAELESLLGRLDEWNEFQDVISTARALRDNQRDVQARTKALRK